MISGSQALGNIEQAIGQQQTAVRDAEARLVALRDEAEAQRKADLDDFRQLARLRLDDLARGEVVGRLERAERQALSLLAERDAARADLEARLAEIDTRIAALQHDRRTHEEAEEAAAARVADAEDATRTRLEGDAAFSALSERAHALDIQADNADEKARQSAQELAEKRRAYEDNALFMYLWKRGYGTSGYSALPLFRTLDSWVARLVGYTDARANFGRLQDIPKRLRDHADRLIAEAEAEEARLDAAWRTARTADRIDALDRAAEGAAAERARVEAAIDDALALQQAALEELARFATGEDERSLSAVELLSRELQQRDLMTLFRDARETLRTEDDRIVGTLADRAQDRQRIEGARAELKGVLDRRLSRLDELVSVAREFKQRRYSQPNSTFRDGALLGMLLQSFLEGALSRDGLWDQLSREQRWRRTSTGTIGGGGVTINRGPVFGGGSRRSGGGFSGGRSSRGGGFRTGGGF